MKYIRSYNESNSAGLTQEEVQDFCETHLAYLMDEGLRVLVKEDDLEVTLSFRLVVSKSWSDIKDQIIPFLTHLRNEYDLVTMDHFKDKLFISPNIRIDIIGSVAIYPDWFNINDIISEKIVPAGRLNDDYKISKIQFKIKDKKV